MKVLYYTQTYYLDAVIETIKSLNSDKLELHLVIEVTPDSKCTNIINIPNLETVDTITSLNSLLGNEKAATFKPYFKAVKSVHFLVFKKQQAFSFDALKATLKLAKYVRHIKPSVVHFDTVTLRSLFYMPLLIGLKKVITVHDPIPHLGESSWKTKLVNHLYFFIAKHFIFYSRFAKKQFQQHYKFCKQPKTVIQFQPFTYNQIYLKPLNKSIEPYILFFGRMSYYKGIDILLSIIPEVLKKHPQLKFIIAGRSEGYEISDEIINQYNQNIILINNYIDSSDLVALIQHSKFLVCPYRDASQSGVLMTSLAIRKPVVGSTVGAFSEYIQDGHNGLIAFPSHDSLLERVLYFLEFDRFLVAESNVNDSFSNSIAISNQHLILETYFN